jgi:hypothetical protein
MSNKFEIYFRKKDFLTYQNLNDVEKTEVRDKIRVYLSNIIQKVSNKPKK